MTSLTKWQVRLRPNCIWTILVPMAFNSDKVILRAGTHDDHLDRMTMSERDQKLLSERFSPIWASSLVLTLLFEHFALYYLKSEMHLLSYFLSFKKISNNLYFVFSYSSRYNNGFGRRAGWRRFSYSYLRWDRFVSDLVHYNIPLRGVIFAETVNSTDIWWVVQSQLVNWRLTAPNNLDIKKQYFEENVSYFSKKHYVVTSQMFRRDDSFEMPQHMYLLKNRKLSKIITWKHLLSRAIFLCFSNKIYCWTLTVILFSFLLIAIGITTSYEHFIKLCSNNIRFSLIHVTILRDTTCKVISEKPIVSSRAVSNCRIWLC